MRLYVLIPDVFLGLACHDKPISSIVHFLIVLFVQTGVALLIKFYGCYDISGSLLFFMTGFGVGFFPPPLGGDLNWDFPCGFSQVL